MMKGFWILPLLLVFSAGPVVQASSSKPPEESAGPKIGYYKMAPSLVMNLMTGGKYVRADVELMTEHPADVEELKTHGPALRHEMLMLLSEQDGNVIKTPDGKQKLREEALKRLQEVMRKLTGKKYVDDVFFTAFFVQ